MLNFKGYWKKIIQSRGSCLTSAAFLFVAIGCVNSTKKEPTPRSAENMDSFRASETALFYSPDSLALTEGLTAFADDIGPGWIGKVKIRPDVDGNDERKSALPAFVSAAQADALQKSMVAAVENHAAHLKQNPTEGPDAASAIDNGDSTKLIFDRCDRGATALTMSKDPNDCAYLVTQPKKGQVVQFEFYLQGPPGNMHQYIYVTTDISQRPAVFYVAQKLANTVNVTYRPDSWQDALLTTVLPSDSEFTPDQSNYVNDKLIGKLWGILDTGMAPMDLREFTLKWEKQQLQKATILAGVSATEIALTLVSAGSATGIMGAWNTAAAAGGKLMLEVGARKVTSLAAKEFLTSSAWLLVKTGMLTGSMYSNLQLKRLQADQDPGPLKDALNVAFILSNISVLYDISGFMRNLGVAKAAASAESAAQSGAAAVVRSASLVDNQRGLESIQKLFFEDTIRRKFTALKSIKSFENAEKALKYKSLLEKNWLIFKSQNKSISLNKTNATQRELLANNLDKASDFFAREMAKSL